ncbi:uncharacterized protein LOC111916270 isoform X2 [Lactuca sativa]|uniref:uncharacterized protein LOC111916270 isoform X2 n=1 Tax=Lactuca sativa TaxID=4236 RepID=UPI000CD8AF1D|nr:uncharacterized protein LOC111916270 isoform X2 [Lactuca sativa]
MEMEMEKGVKRWLVNISQWNPTPNEFSIAMSVLPQEQHSSITRFMKTEDQKRALVSRLLQYALVHEVLEIPFEEIIIHRTPEDIVCCVNPGKETVSEFIRNFSSYFSSSEWEKIVNAGSDDHVLDVFFRNWCLKEAFVKALGTGVGYKLDYVEFQHKDWADIYVKVDGDTLKDWNFWLFELQGRHRVAVARGNPRMASESYKKTLKQTHFDNDLYKLGFHLPNPRFLTRTVEELCALFHLCSYKTSF